MSVFLCILIGYTLGILNPAALIAALRKVDLRALGTKNLGATNVAITVGKRLGILVMAFDMAKAFFAVRIARALFPDYDLAALTAGCSAVLGHIFPVQLGFRGGKGLAAFGGMILAVDPGLFLILLLCGISVALLTDFASTLPFTAASLAPFLAAWRAWSLTVGLYVLTVSAVILWKHRENIGKMRSGEEVRLRAYFRRDVDEA